MSVRAEPVQLGNDERSLVAPAGTDGARKLRTVGALPALNLGVLGAELPLAAVEMIDDGLALSLSPSPERP